MSAVRQIVSGSILSQVISLPKNLQNSQVEVIVRPVAQKERSHPMTCEQLQRLLYGSHTEALSGVILTDDDIDLDELRAERRTKYERSD